VGQPTQRLVTIPAGASQAKVCLITVADDDHETGPQTVILSILPSPSYTVGSPSTTTVTIVDDD
jgi:hypothetical protein